MSTENTNSNDICDFCRRDVGLKIFVNRYLFAKNFNAKNDLDSSDNQKKLYDLSSQKNILNEFLNPKPEEVIPFKIDSKSDHAIKVEKVTVTESRKNFYAKNKNTQIAKGFMYAGESFGYAGGILRQGFLYVYFKHLNKWHEYTVSESGFLKRINENDYFEVTGDPQANNVNVKKEPCIKVAHRAAALTVTIPKPLEASTVYFKYSENAWSKATKKRNNSFSFFEKYMDVFDVQKFLNGQYQKGAFPMVNGITKFNIDGSYKNENDENNFAEWNITANNKGIKNALMYLSGETYEDIFSKISKNSGNREDQLLSTLNIGNTKSFLSSCQKKDLEEAIADDKKLRVLFGAVFAINDPIAEIMDISSYIANTIVDDSSYSEKEQTVNIIETLKTQYMGINNEPLFTLDERIEKDRSKAMQDMVYAADGAIITPSMFEDKEMLSPEQKQAKEIAEKKVEQANKTNEWYTKYVHKINKTEYTNNLRSLNVKKEDQANIADDLDNLLLGLLAGDYVSDHLFFNTEKGNLNDLTIKLMSVNYILESIKGCPKSNVFYSQFMYKTNDPNNYFLNTMSLDSDTIRAKMNDAINKFQLSDHSSFATMPFSDLLNASLAYADEKIPVVMENISGAIYTNLANCILHILPLKPPPQFASHPLVPVLVTIASKSNISFDEIHFPKNNYSQFCGAVRVYLRSVYNLMGVTNINDNVLGQMIADDPYWKGIYDRYKTYGKFLLPKVDLNNKYLAVLPQQYKAAYQFHRDILNGKEKNVIKRIEVFRFSEVNENVLSDVNETKFYISKICVASLQVWGCIVTFGDENLSGAERKLKRMASLAGVTTAFMEMTAMMSTVFNKAISNSIFFKKLNSFVLHVTGPSLLKDLPTGSQSRIPLFKNAFPNKTLFKRVFLWRSIGLFGSWVSGIFDVISGIDAYSNGEKTFGAWLFASGISVLGGSLLLFFFATNPAGWVLFFAGVAFAIIAYAKRDNAIQLWIRKCILTVDSEIRKYSDFQIQTQELEGIFK